MMSWERFVAQFKKDLKQWLFFMATLSFFRLVFILYFHTKIQTGTRWIDILDAFVNGMRYDAMAATYFAVPLLPLTILCGFADVRRFSDAVRSVAGWLFIILTTVLSVVTLTYFQEYNDQFNHFLFNLYYDDTKAIVSTIWAQYHVIPNVLAMTVLSIGIIFGYRRFLRSPALTGRILNRPLPVVVRAVMAVLVCVMILIGSRGSYGHRPLKIEDAAVTRDEFLNKAVLNPYSALMYAYGAHARVNYVMSGLSLWIPDRDVAKAARELFNDPRAFDNLDAYLLRKAPGHANRKPEHVFLVVMESYDAWPLMKQYASLGLTRELADLGRRGIHVKNFLPASDGTATSLSALITGLPDANVVTNYQKQSRTSYPSSIAESFKRLGYRTRFFYGGYLSWQQFGEFVKDQGFDEVYGAAHIGSWESHNEWGVEDEALFNFILKTVGAAPSRPSLNVIMTTSYHPPYELDVYGKGFPLKAVPDDLSAQFDGSVSLKMLGHLWYADRCIGDFVRRAEKKFELPLFAFTGDHYGRKFINIHPGKFEASAVPFILYGKDVLRNVTASPNAVGSHIDIAPTLIELCAPKGFSYYGVGHSVLGPDRPRFGVNRDRVIGKDFLYDIWEKKFYPLPGTALPEKLPDPRDLKLLHDREAGIAWWRIMRGSHL